MNSFLAMKTKMQEEFKAPPVPIKSVKWIGESTPLTRVDSDGPRVYIDSKGIEYISVTSILSLMPQFGKTEMLKGWVSYLGKEESTKMTNKGALRGTAIHEAVESWIKDEEIKSLDGNKLYQRLFKQIAESISEHVHSFIASEIQVKSPIGFAGTTDAVGLVKFGPGQIFQSIIDFKNYARAKSKEDMLAAFYQVALYSIAVEHTTGIITNAGLIIASDESGEKAQTFFLPPDEFRRLKIEALAETIKVLERRRNEAIS